MKNNLAIIDFNRTIYDPETDTEVPGATELLTRLKETGITLVLVSLKEAHRAETLSRLHLDRFFDQVEFVDEKTALLFGEIAKERGVTPGDTIVIGDHPHDIGCGIEAGMRTIRLRRGRFAHLEEENDRFKPWRTVEHLSEVHELIPLI